MGGMSFGELLALFPLSFAAAADVRHRTIPNWTVLLTFLCVFLRCVQGELFWGTALAGGVGIGVTLLLWAVRSDGVGGGDVKLGAAVGALLGLQAGLWVLATALLLLLLWGRATRAEKLPFAPFLLCAALLRQIRVILQFGGIFQ